MFHAHGVGGLFLYPDKCLDACVCSPRRVSSRKYTAFNHAHISENQFETVACSLAEGVGINTITRIHNLNKSTVLRVLAQSADHVEKVTRNMLGQLVVSECQLDEMWSFVGKKEKNLNAVEKAVGSLGDAWIWIAFDAVHKIFMAQIVGKRTLPHAVALLEEVKRVTSSMPLLFSSDQLDQYARALLQGYGVSFLPSKKPGPGRPPKPRLIPPDDLLYVQVVKKYKANRIVSVTRRVVFGDAENVEDILRQSTVSNKINTAYVERGNGTIRHLNSRCNRKTYRFSKSKINHVRQLTLSIAYYHLCLPHKTLTKRSGRPTTPFMSAGLTDHVWTMGEILQYPVKKEDI